MDLIDINGLWSITAQFYRGYGGGVVIAGSGWNISSISFRGGIGIGGGISLNPLGGPPDPNACPGTNSIGVNAEAALDFLFIGVGKGWNTGATLDLNSNRPVWSGYGGSSPSLEFGNGSGVGLMYGAQFQGSATVEITRNF